MDNLTHSLVGAAVSKAGADRATPLATATLVIAANAPDIDVLSFVHGSYYALAVRRGLTHGFPALAVLAIVVTAGVLTWDRMVRLKRRPEAIPARPVPVLGLAVIGLLSHPALDWMNVYGMRWALPFDPTWTYGDALFIIDPWIWLALGGALFLTSDLGPRATGVVGAAAAFAAVLIFVGMGPAAGVVWCVGVGLVALGRRRATAIDGRRGRRIVTATAGATTLYMGLMLAADGRAREHVRAAAAAQQWTVTDVLVSPSRANPFVAAVEVKTDLLYVPGTHRWFGTPRVDFDQHRAVPIFVPPVGESPERTQQIVNRAASKPDAAHFLTWSRFPWTRVEGTDNGWTVHFGDARYDDVPEASALGGVTVEVTHDEVR